MNERGRCVLLVSAVTLFAQSLAATPFSYGASTPDVQEFVVDCITNCICRRCSFALMQYREDEVLRPEDHALSWSVKMGLGLDEWRCLEMLKGDGSVASNTVCYLYPTPRIAGKLPMFDFSPLRQDGTNVFSYFSDGRWVDGSKKELWRFDPPYDPFEHEYDEFAQLMLLDREQCLDKGRICVENQFVGTNTIPTIAGAAAESLAPQELMRRIGAEAVFSNRVYRMNEGCVFQVDYSSPQMDWRRTTQTRESFEETILTNRILCTNLMRLGAEELSELLYLAYAVEGDVAGYEAARARSSIPLCSVTQIRTVIGSRVLSALAGGAVLTNASLFVSAGDYAKGEKPHAQ